jgi:flagellar assembly protein FliH
MTQEAPGQPPRDITRMLASNPSGTTGFVRDTRFANRPDTLPESAAVPFAALGGRAWRSYGGLAAAEAAAPDPIEAARAEAYARGFAEGAAEAQAQASATASSHSNLALSFARIDAEMAERLRQRLIDTVLALCESCLKPLATDKKALARRVDKAVGMFVRADDDTLIRLHPEDLAAVRELLPTDWAFAEDANLARGALRVETRSRGVDGGGVEDGPEQWRKAIAQALDLGGAA